MGGFWVIEGRLDLWDGGGVCNFLKDFKFSKITIWGVILLYGRYF